MNCLTRFAALAAIPLALGACAEAPDGTARPEAVQEQLRREARAATNCTEAQAVFDRFLAASESTRKATDRSRQQLELLGIAYDRGKELDCPAFP